MAGFSPRELGAGLLFQCVIAALTSVFLASPVSGQIDCDASHTVTTQEDIDILYQCADLETPIGGDLRISSEATGRLELRNVGAITGNIVLDDNSSLESLVLETDHGDFTRDGNGIGLFIRNATALTEVTGGASARFSTIEMRDITILKSIQLGGIPPPETLRLSNCQQLLDFSLGPGDGVIANNIELHTVGLRQFEDFFHRGAQGQNITLGGLMREDFLFYSLYDAHTVSISTDGPRTLHVQFMEPKDIDENDPPSELRVENLEVAKVGEFGGFVSDFLLLPSVGTLNVHDTEILHLQVRVKDLSHLIVHDNRILTELRHNSDFADYSWKSISFRNNPEWRPELRNQSHDYPEGGWVWPSKQLETVELQGHFNPAIFTEWIEKGKQSEEPLVTKKFFLETFSKEEDGSVFDCGPLDDLHKRGKIQGEYSCRGVDVSTASTDHPLTWKAWVATFVAVVVTFL